MLHPKELTIAASRGNLDLVKSILGQGIDFNAEGEDGKTALMLACEKGHEEIVEYLKNPFSKQCIEGFSNE